MSRTRNTTCPRHEHGGLVNTRRSSTEVETTVPRQPIWPKRMARSAAGLLVAALVLATTAAQAGQRPTGAQNTCPFNAAQTHLIQYNHPAYGPPRGYRGGWRPVAPGLIIAPNLSLLFPFVQLGPQGRAAPGGYPQPGAQGGYPGAAQRGGGVPPDQSGPH